MALIQVSTLYLLLLIAVHAHAYYLPFENTVSPNEPDEDLLHSILQELIKSELAAKQANEPPLESKQIQVQEDPNWPNGSHASSLANLDQVSSIAFTNDGRLFVLHRADRAWNSSLKMNELRTPIAADTVMVVNASNGNLIQNWGSNLFYMPHGISIDSDGNVWITDVAAHQVFRFRRDSYETPELVLGERFVSGVDDQHFCMPTDVQIASNGFVYIADGYCNSRILIVAPDGSPIGQIAHKDGMTVPHSLTLLENEDLICVADRERQRILCYSAGLSTNAAGELRFRLQHPSLRRVYGLAHVGDALIAVNGPTSNDDREEDPVGLVLDLATERLLTSFYPKKAFVAPHDVQYDPISKSLIVVDLQSPHRPLIKFQVQTPYN